MSDAVESRFVVACGLYVAFGTKATWARTAYHFFCLYYVVSIDLWEDQASILNNGSM